MQPSGGGMGGQLEGVDVDENDMQSSGDLRDGTGSTL